MEVVKATHLHRAVHIRAWLAPSVVTVAMASVCLPLLLQSPPAQLKQVYGDLRGILRSSAAGVEESALREEASPYLEQHAREQLSVVDVQADGRSQPTIVCEAAKLAPEGFAQRYVHAGLNVSFVYDPLEEQARDAKPFVPHAALDSQRRVIYTHLDKYVQDHYQGGVSAVFAAPYASASPDAGSSVEGSAPPSEGDVRSAATDTPGAQDTASEVGSVSQRAAATTDEGGNGSQCADATADKPTSSASTAAAMPTEDVCAETAAELSAGTLSPEADAAAAQSTQTDDKTAGTTAGSAEDSAADAERPPSAHIAGAEQADSQGSGGNEAPAEPSHTSAGRESLSAQSAPPTAGVSVLAAAADAADDASLTPTRIVMHIVGNKYNLRNYYVGRWRSSYEFDAETGKFTNACIQTQVHYFENGNVQLNTRNDTLLELPTSAAASGDKLAKGITAAIAKHEQAYQEALFETIDTLREKAFRELRRTLPITRQKIDWDQAVSYKLGSELAQRESS